MIWFSQSRVHPLAEFGGGKAQRLGELGDVLDAGIAQAALDAGALGASISGGGPSVFGWFESRAAATAAAAAMQAAFLQAGLQSDALVSAVNAPGARVIA